MLKEKKQKKILIICPHPVGVAPGQRLKYEQYFDYLEENGYEVKVSSFMTMRFWNIVYKKGYYLEKFFWTIIGYCRRLFDLFRLPFYDGIYIFLYVVPFGPPFFEYLFSKVNPNFIYDIDDLVFLKPQSKANPLVAFLKSKNNSIYLMKSAKHVITCTPYLDKFVRQYNSITTDISSTINTDNYRPKKHYTLTKEKPILGWSGSFSTSKYLFLLKDVLLKLAKEFDFKLLVMGDPSFNIEGLDVEAIAWKEEYEVVTISRFDIGLYPLPNEEWVMGKSGLKALQYMSLGIPTVATAIGTNFRIIEDGVSGFLVNSDDQWYEKIKQLLLSEPLRRKIGIESAKRVENNYSINANQDTYLQIFDNYYR